MGPQKIWNLMYVVGNPKIFTKIVANASNPMKRSIVYQRKDVWRPITKITLNTSSGTKL